MVELVIIACLLRQPERCEEFHVPFINEMNVVQCVWQSTIHAATWVAAHPGWVIRKVRCAEPRA
jgi:hypothetical protein